MVDRNFASLHHSSISKLGQSYYKLVQFHLPFDAPVDVTDAPYERRGVIVTTNLPFEQWSEVLGSERLTGATLDRLTHRCSVIETGVESYRLRDARRRRRSPSKETRGEAQAEAG